MKDSFKAYTLTNKAYNQVKHCFRVISVLLTFFALLDRVGLPFLLYGKLNFVNISLVSVT